MINKIYYIIYITVYALSSSCLYMYYVRIDSLLDDMIEIVYACFSQMYILSLISMQFLWVNLETNVVEILIKNSLFLDEIITEEANKIDVVVEVDCSFKNHTCINIRQIT